MRDRRNTTNLSISSASSTHSSPTSAPSRASLQEKRHSSSPPPSPSPTLVKKENVSKSHGRPRLLMAVKLFATVCAIVALWHFLLLGSFDSLSFAFSQSQIDRDGVTPLPDKPAALKIVGERGHSRWTVSIPHNHSFPLQSTQYRDICWQSQLLRDSVSQESRLVRAKDWRRKNGYYSVDRTFLDIDEAEKQGSLPAPKDEAPGPFCDRSLTFSLDTEDASFGTSLLQLWLSYGLAKKEGRAFFVDDTRWPYGRYASYFTPPPSPGCVRPPPHRIVPCPHSARHLVVSAATLPWTFGASFEEEFTQMRKTGVERSHRVFDLLRSGYEDLFRITGEDALYSASRIARFKEEAHQYGGSIIGMHIRRGDLHPIEYQFSGDYLPLERYAIGARHLLQPEPRPEAVDIGTPRKDTHSPLLLASDDPELFDSTELKQGATPLVIQKAQERIQLATKAALDLTSPTRPLREPGSAYFKHVDENSGWEGGFYSRLFFSLGRERGRPGRNRASNSTDDALPENVVHMRELIGRAYLLDIAVLGQSDGVVCAVSSATCRVLGVMLGWDAVKEGRWINVDDGRAWSWDGRR